MKDYEALREIKSNKKQTKFVYFDFLKNEYVVTRNYHLKELYIGFVYVGKFSGNYNDYKLSQFRSRTFQAVFEYMEKEKFHGDFL